MTGVFLFLICILYTKVVNIMDFIGTYKLRLIFVKMSIKSFFLFSNGDLHAGLCSLRSVLMSSSFLQWSSDICLQLFLQQLSQFELQQLFPLNPVLQFKLQQLFPLNPVLQFELQQLFPLNPVLQFELQQLFPLNPVLQFELQQLLLSEQQKQNVSLTNPKPVQVPAGFPSHRTDTLLIVFDVKDEKEPPWETIRSIVSPFWNSIITVIIQGGGVVLVICTVNSPGTHERFSK